jgi:hypothetical protein
MEEGRMSTIDWKLANELKHELLQSIKYKQKHENFSIVPLRYERSSWYLEMASVKGKFIIYVINLLLKIKIIM